MEDIIAGIAFMQNCASIQTVQHIGSGHFFFHKAVWEYQIVRGEKIAKYISHCDHLRSIIAPHFFQWSSVPGIQINLSFFFDKTPWKRRIIYKIAGAAERSVISNRAGTYKMYSGNGILVKLLTDLLFNTFVNRENESEFVIGFFAEFF